MFGQGPFGVRGIPVGVSDPSSVLGVVQAQFFELGAGGVEFCPLLGRAGNKGFEPSDFLLE